MPPVHLIPIPRPIRFGPREHIPLSINQLLGEDGFLGGEIVTSGVHLFLLDVRHDHPVGVVPLRVDDFRLKVLFLDADIVPHLGAVAEFVHRVGHLVSAEVGDAIVQPADEVLVEEHIGAVEFDQALQKLRAEFSFVPGRNG